MRASAAARFRFAGNSLLVTGTVDASGNAAGGNIAMQAQDIRQQGQVRADATAGNGGTVEANFAKNCWSAVEFLDDVGARRRGGAIPAAACLFRAPVPVRPCRPRATSMSMVTRAMAARSNCWPTMSARDGGRQRDRDRAGTGGGEVLVGGNPRGAGPEPNARIVAVEALGSSTPVRRTAAMAAALIPRADDTTRAVGVRSKVRGRAIGGGLGGFVEVSAKRSLAYTGSAGELRAPAGRRGPSAARS